MLFGRNGGGFVWNELIFACLVWGGRCLTDKRSALAVVMLCLCGRVVARDSMMWRGGRDGRSQIGAYIVGVKD